MGGGYAVVYKWVLIYLETHGVAGLKDGVYLHPDAFEAFINNAGNNHLYAALKADFTTVYKTAAARGMQKLMVGFMTSSKRVKLNMGNGSLTPYHPTVFLVVIPHPYPPLICR